MPVASLHYLKVNLSILILSTLMVQEDFLVDLTREKEEGWVHSGSERWDKTEAEVSEHTDRDCLTGMRCMMISLKMKFSWGEEPLFLHVNALGLYQGAFFIEMPMIEYTEKRLGSAAMLKHGLLMIWNLIIITSPIEETVKPSSHRWYLNSCFELHCIIPYGLRYHAWILT